MAGISDRTLEHLAPSDRMIGATRRRLIDAVRAWRKAGAIPALLDNPGVAGNARSGEIIAPERQPWTEAYEQALDEAAPSGHADAGGISSGERGRLRWPIPAARENGP